MSQWQLQEAKARFSELVKTTLKEGAQHISVHGKPAVVVLSALEYDQLIKPELSFYDFLRQSPLIGMTLHLKRNASLTRDVDL